MERQQRRLAAILAADVEGYSRLMGVDESGTLAQFNALRAGLLDPKIAEFKGRVAGSAGDSLLLEFASAMDAVQCAVEMQERLAEAGSVVIGRSIHDQVKGRLPYSFDDLGEHSVKNIAEPIKAFRVDREARPGAGPMRFGSGRQSEIPLPVNRRLVVCIRSGCR